MVKKLFKYEINYYLRTLLLIFPITVMLGIGTLVLSPLRNLDSPLASLYYLSMGPLFLGIAVSVIAPIAINVIRFYKNMYSNEGYLTFSLPVSNHAHLLTKILTGAIFEVLGIIIAIITVLIAFASIKEFWIGIANFFTEIYDAIVSINGVHIIFYLLEIIILIVISLVSSPLIYYTCVSLGQLGKKNRIVLAVLIYYGFTIAVQIISSFGMVILSILGMNGFFDPLSNFIDLHPYASIHIGLILSIIFSAGVSCLLYFANYKLMTNKLNLE